VQRQRPLRELLRRGVEHRDLVAPIFGDQDAVLVVDVHAPRSPIGGRKRVPCDLAGLGIDLANVAMCELGHPEIVLRVGNDLVCTDNSSLFANRLTSRAMIALLCFFLTLFASPFKSRSRLEAENAALRHQLIVLQRKVRRRVHLTNGDRLFLVQLYRWFPSVLKAITIIRPETLLRWHRAGFRRYWRWKSRSLGGRPKIAADLRALIRRITTKICAARSCSISSAMRASSPSRARSRCRLAGWQTGATGSSSP
jgi:hypothetical protein